MTVHNHLKVEFWREPIGFGTGLGGDWQNLSEVRGEIEVDMSIEDYHAWLKEYLRNETDFQEWLAGELSSYDLDGISPTQVVVDDVDEETGRLTVSVEDWERA